MNRSISAEQFLSIIDKVMVLDIRRKDDFDSSDLKVSCAEWKDPALIDQWLDSIPQDKDLVIYCVRGGGVSNSVVDRLLAAGLDASFVEGGIVALEGTKNILVSKAIAS